MRDLSKQFRDLSRTFHYLSINSINLSLNFRKISIYTFMRHYLTALIIYVA